MPCEGSLLIFCSVKMFSCRGRCVRPVPGEVGTRRPGPDRASGDRAPFPSRGGRATRKDKT